MYAASAQQEKGKPYYVRAFDSATGYCYWQVMGPFGRKAEYLDRADAVSHADRLNASV
jgi:hypothetical protein